MKCNRKVRFPEKHHADAEMERIKKKNWKHQNPDQTADWLLNSYLCPECSFWHIGHDWSRRYARANG